MAPEERKQAGAALNRAEGQGRRGDCRAQGARCRKPRSRQRLATEKVDVTLPVRPQAQGTIHPVSQVWEEVVQIWGDLGFAVAEGPHIEDDFHNFTALNMPPEHPARQEHDTFYFNAKPDGSRMVLRTHTSPVQIRTMLSQKPPIRIIAPGRTFRYDCDLTHTPMFHQIEGLVIDEQTHLGHLKWALDRILQGLLRGRRCEDALPRLAFPLHRAVDGSRHQLLLGRRPGEDRHRHVWLEILGSGMVHPNVIKAGGLDPEQYQGLAFGMGLDRIAMLKYGIPDLRAFFEADLRWLRHYGFRALDVPTLAGGLS